MWIQNPVGTVKMTAGLIIYCHFIYRRLLFHCLHLHRQFKRWLPLPLTKKKREKNGRNRWWDRDEVRRTGNGKERKQTFRGLVMDLSKCWPLTVQQRWMNPQAQVPGLYRWQDILNGLKTSRQVWGTFSSLCSRACCYYWAALLKETAWVYMDRWPVTQPCNYSSPPSYNEL